jgi:hypothetical protein
MRYKCGLLDACFGSQILALVIAQSWLNHCCCLLPSRRRWRRWEWRCLSRWISFPLNRAGSKNLAFVGFDPVVDGLVCNMIPEFSDAAEMEEPEVAWCSWPPGASILPPTCTCVCLVSFKVGTSAAYPALQLLIGNLGSSSEACCPLCFL